MRDGDRVYAPGSRIELVFTQIVALVARKAYGADIHVARRDRSSSAAAELMIAALGSVAVPKESSS